MLPKPPPYACDSCRDTGMAICYLDDKDIYYLMGCFDCAMGTAFRGHSMMHSQSRDCPYRHIANYWKKR
jgi:hypothetical protein